MNNKKLKELLLNTLASATPSRNIPRIIYYHSIHPFNPNSMHPEIFSSQLLWLIDQGYSIYHVSEFMKRFYQSNLSNKSVAISFDDGYTDNYEYAIPILLKLNLKATFFVVSDYVNETPTISNYGNKLFKNKNIMSRNMLQEIHRLGMDIGSHSKSHVNIKEVFQKKPLMAKDELFISKEKLENIINEKISSFAYPNGQRGVFSRQTSSYLKLAGYEYGFTTMWGGVQSNINRYEIPRIEIADRDSIKTFAWKIRGKYDVKIIIHKILYNSKRW